MQNPFIWHDLMTTDVARAEKFYSAVLGWTFTDQPPAYRVANVEGIGIGGILDLPPELKGMTPFWDGYIFVTDVDAACARCLALGGQVCKEPWDIPGILRMAVLADPSGAKFNIMQPFMSEPEAKVRPDAQGVVSWHELNGGDTEKDFAFYSALFGWTKGETMSMGESGNYQLFQIDGQDFGGMMKRLPHMPHAHWAYYFNVDGIEAAIARLQAAGGTVLMGPEPVPGGWVVNASDDQGAAFSLISTSK